MKFLLVLVTKKERKGKKNPSKSFVKVIKLN